MNKPRVSLGWVVHGSAEGSLQAVEKGTDTAHRQDMDAAAAALMCWGSETSLCCSSEIPQRPLCAALQRLCLAYSSA